MKNIPTTKPTMRCVATRSRGATMVEYTVGLVALITVLLAPVPTKNKNVVQLLEEAIKKEHSAYIYASSLPSPEN
ncbi:hypothetical protein DFR28_102802 [Arenicella xantha]|uniref:Uncharacterized protein n=1 Tax=Arenicella xantha TaxID=644221 RepID=A0A395JKT8_9GAMM|nr:hypothetical protein DFR28_102802 [Arenicella xantha]